jgi:tetratricopeptide (TPR) repeat protein
MKQVAAYITVTLTGIALLGEPCFAETADTWYSSGITMQKSGDLKEAVRMYSKAIELDGNYVMAYQMRASALQKMNKFSKAIEDYTMVINLGEPSFKAVGYLNRGIVKNMTGHFSEAIPDFNLAISMDRRMGPAFFHRAIARSKTGDTPGTLDDFVQAARLGDTDAERFLDAIDPEWRLKNQIK